MSGVSIKTSLSPDGGACPSAKNMVANPPNAKVWKVNSPKLKVVFNPGPYLETFHRIVAADRKLLNV